MNFPSKIEELLLSTLIMSLKILSKSSKHNLYIIGASSYIINFANSNSSASTLLWWILQIELSVGTIILNFECVVPSKNRDAMLLEATINTIQYSFNSKSDINCFIFNRYNGPAKKNRYNFDKENTWLQWR